jgi:hypothetical protein
MWAVAVERRQKEGKESIYIFLWSLFGEMRTASSHLKTFSLVDEDNVAYYPPHNFLTE